MIDTVRTVLGEAVKAYSDTRLHYCRVEVAALEGVRCALAGAVLDGATLHGLLAALAAAGYRDELARLGSEIGLPADDVRAMLASDDMADEVRADEQAARENGIQGVPFFVFDDRYAVSGAQPVDAFREVLDEVWRREHAQA